MDEFRNFVIIAHVDHGKSTLADRMLEVTGTVEARRMKNQYLDQLELERERGITIKMAPVRMKYRHEGKDYVLNLIDTPGHSDFSYEVSRALAAVEGAVLLVDATQGIQAQTLANFHKAKEAGLTIVGAVNKIDLFESRPADLQIIVASLAKLISQKEEDIYLISGKSGAGVPELLKGMVKRFPSPKMKSTTKEFSRGLIFDSFYDNHKGVVASIRVFDGSIKAGDAMRLVATETDTIAKEIGYFTPELKSIGDSGALSAGETGYIATGVRDPQKIKIGDTVLVFSKANEYLKKNDEFLKKAQLPGYSEPRPVVFVSFYPEEGDEYDLLNRGLEKLKLNDSSLTTEPDQNEVLGRGFKVGFLGRLHFEITAERLKREFHVPTVNTFPSVAYRIKTKLGEWETIIKPEDLPQDYLEIWEPTARVSIITPQEYVSSLFPLQARFRMSSLITETLENRTKVDATMPLAELITDFDDQLKSITAGYASFSYTLGEYVRADIIKVDILISGEAIAGLSRFFPKNAYEREGRKMVERLKEILPRQQFTQSLQASVAGKVIAREDIAAMRKDVTGYLYGGDRSRKMKLWKKQQRGKKRLKERAEAKLTPELFKELLKT